MQSCAQQVIKSIAETQQSRHRGLQVSLGELRHAWPMTRVMSMAQNGGTGTPRAVSFRPKVPWCDWIL